MKKSNLLLPAFICVVNCAFAQATFAPAINYPVINDADHVTAGDFNHDGKTDVVVATDDFSSQVLIYYQNYVTGALDTPAVEYSYPTTSSARAIAAGDINNDGRDDIAIAYGDTIGIFYQNTSGTMNPLVSMWCSSGEVAVIKIADVDMDGFNDIVAVPMNTSSNVIVYYGTASGGFTEIDYPTPYTGTYLDDLRVGKIGSDTLNSLIRMSGETADNPIVQLRIRRNRALDATITRNIVSIWGVGGVEIGAFSDTAENQIAATISANAPNSQLAVWRHPDTELVADTLIDVADIPQPLATGHLGCSPTEQIVILHGGWDKISVIDFIHGITTYPVSCPNNAAHDAVVVADVNGDGKPDIVAVNTYAGLSVLLNTTLPPIDTSIVVTHATMYDSILVSSASSVVMDTTSVTGGIVITKDSIFAGEYSVKTIMGNDSGRLIYNGCDGDTASYTSYLHSVDSVSNTHMDTILTITRDTLINDEVGFVSEANIKMYPNPFAKGITIEVPGRFFAAIYTIVGQAIESGEGDGKICFNLVSLPAGVYMLVVEDAGHNVLCRSPVVKQ